MKRDRFERLIESLDEVRAHVATGRFAGWVRASDDEMPAADLEDRIVQWPLRMPKNARGKGPGQS